MFSRSVLVCIVFALCVLALSQARPRRRPEDGGSDRRLGGGRREGIAKGGISDYERLDGARPRGGRPGRPYDVRPGGNDGRPEGGRPRPRPGPVACFQYKIVDGANKTTYDQPCAFSAENSGTEAPLFECSHRPEGLIPRRPWRNSEGEDGEEYPIRPRGPRRRSEEDEDAEYTTSHCVPSGCSSDDECRKDSTCNQELGRCNVTLEYRMYAKACEVQNATDSTDVVHSRPCIRDNDFCNTNSSGKTFTLEGVDYRAFVCRREQRGEGSSEEDVDADDDEDSSEETDDDEESSEETDDDDEDSSEETDDDEESSEETDDDSEESSEDDTDADNNPDIASADEFEP